MNRQLLSVLSILIIFFSCSTPKEEKTKEIIKEFRITLSQADLDGIYDNPKPNTYIPITIVYNEDTVRTAKMRIRGDSSREYNKKSLKILFEKGDLLKGEGRKINLNSEWTDKSYIRQYLSAHLMSEAGINAFNTNFVKLLINGQFFGLYLQVENIDKSFLKRNKLDEKGNLYKATKDGACLSEYDNIKKAWEKKTNKYTDWQDIGTLITSLDTLSEEHAYQYLKNNFDYDKLITIVAMNMLIQNSSTYYHNYYMYHDIYGSNKWQMLPWDLDKTMSYYNWKPYVYDETSNKWLSDNVLVERVLLNEKALNDVINKVKTLGKTVFNSNNINPIIDMLALLLEEAIKLDGTDQVDGVAQWKGYLQREKDFVVNQVNNILTQLKTRPRGFLVNKVIGVQISSPVLTWEASKSPIKKEVFYKVWCSKDYLFEDKKTIFIDSLRATSYKVPEDIDFGQYFWKIQASDGEHIIDGFNSRNTFEYKKPTIVTTKIDRNASWTKEKSPYYLTKDLTVLGGAKLTIEKGTEIILAEDINIFIKGQIVINGEKDQKVVFKPEGKQWGEIHLYDNKNKINYTDFNEGVFRANGSEVELLNTTFNVKNKNLLYGGYRQAVIWVKNGKFTMNYCRLYSNGTGEGMNINFAETEIMNSYFNNAPDAIEIMNVTKGLIYRNFVENSPDDAVDMNGCKNVIALGNYIINNNDKAFSIGTEEYGPSNNIVVENNLIINNGTGISVKDSSDVLIKNNTVINVNRGVSAYLKNNKKQYLIGGKAEAVNNIFNSTNTAVIDFDKNSEVNVSYSMTEKMKIKGAGNIIGVPNFINQKRGNYYLFSNSTCLNTGKDGENMGLYSKNNSFLSIIKQDSFYAITNPNIFNVDLSGYMIKIDNEKEIELPRYILKPEEQLVLTNNPKGLTLIENRIVEVKGLKKTSKRVGLFDNNKSRIFLLENE